MKTQLLFILIFLISCNVPHESAQENANETANEWKEEIKKCNIYNSHLNHGIDIICNNLEIDNPQLTVQFVQEVLCLERLAKGDNMGFPECTQSNRLINQLYYLTSVHPTYYQDSTYIKNILLGHLQKNRDKDLIKLVYNKNKKYFFNSIAKDYYQSSGLKNVIMSLLYAHQDLEGSDMAALYQKTIEESVHYAIFEPYITSRVKKLLPRFKDKALNKQFPENEWDDVLWCYSFWTRRYAEDNADVVYEILQEFHQNLNLPK